MKKALIFIGILIVLIVGLLFLNSVTKKSDEEYIDTYLTNTGFIYDEDGDFYKKVTSSVTLDEYFDNVSNDKASEYTELYFYSGSYKLTKLKMTYNDDVYNVFTIEYNLIERVISYSYEISIYSSSIILNGNYILNLDDEDNNFTCEVVDMRLWEEDRIDAYCTRAKYEIFLFLEEANEVVSNPRFSSIIDNGLIEVVEE